MAELVGRVKRKERQDEDLYMDELLSTQSTGLDLAISGGVSRYGGIPGGIMVEVFGPPGWGKTVLLIEILSSAMLREGRVLFVDPEGRLNKAYAAVHGVDQISVVDSSKCRSGIPPRPIEATVRTVIEVYPVAPSRGFVRERGKRHDYWLRSSGKYPRPTWLESNNEGHEGALFHVLL